MTESELEAILSVRFEEGCVDQWGDLILEHDLFPQAMNLALRAKGVIPFRASYALERAFLKAPARFEPYYERFANDFGAVSHPSVWRHYGKIMSILLKKNRLLLSDTQAENVAEAVVIRLVDEAIPVGSRVYSLDILYYLRRQVLWVDVELPGILENLKIAPSPAMISRLRRFGWLRKGY